MPSMTVSPIAGDDAAEHARVDDDLHFDLLPGGAGERRRRAAGLLGVVERHRACGPRRSRARGSAAASSTNRSTISGRSRPRPDADDERRERHA